MHDLTKDICDEDREKIEHMKECDNIVGLSEEKTVSQPASPYIASAFRVTLVIINFINRKQ